MGYTFDPLLFSGLVPLTPSSSVPTVPTVGSLPATAANGALYITLDTGDLYEYRSSIPGFVIIGGPGVMLGIGPIDSQTPSANGAVDANNALVLQSASATAPGLVNQTSQVMGAGVKSFSSQTQFSDGLMSLPGISFSAEPATGIYRAASHDLAFSVNNTDVLDLTPSQITPQVNIIPANSSIALGSASIPYADLYTQNVINPTIASNLNINTSAQTGSSNSGTLSLTSGGVANGTAGNVFLQAGSASGSGTSGAIQFGSNATFLNNTVTGLPVPSLSSATSPLVVAQMGAANGVATLDASSKIPLNQLPSVVMEYQGAWNPNTNSPALSDGTGTNGYVYYVTAQRSAAVSGLTDPSMVNFQIGDLVIYSSSVGKWQLVTPAAGVQSVNGAQGAVTVNAINQLTGDVTAGPASQSQSQAATIAKIQGTTVSGTTGTSNVVFSASPTLSGTLTAAAATLTGALGGTSAVFSSTISASNLSGTNSGDVTLAAVGAASNAQAASLSGQVLTLEPFSSSFPGVVTASGGGTSNFLRADATWATPPVGFTSPMTTAGDMIYENSTPAAARLPIGINGQVLTVSGGFPAWTTLSTSYANQSLSNLTTTSINQNLLPASNNSISIGNSSLTYNGVFTQSMNIYSGSSGIGAVGSSTTPSGSASGYSFYSTSTSEPLLIYTPLALGATSSIYMETGYTVGVSSNPTGMISQVTGAQQSSSSTGSTGEISFTTGTTAGPGTTGAIVLTTGNGTSVGSGSINLQTGTTSSGTSGNILLDIGAGGGSRGKIQFVNGSEGTAGQVWTSTDSSGSGSWAAPATHGTVTSVGLADTSATPIYAVSNTPVTSSGTIDITLNTQSANLIFAGPSTGSAAQPSFRSLVTADLPTVVPGDIQQTSFTIANNQSSATNVTGLVFANATVESAMVQYSIVISATTALYESGTINLIQKGGTWSIAQESNFDNTNVIFSITNSGQVQYTSPSYTGYTNGKMQFRAMVTGV
jgi:hypothetical protein